jgi:predicted phage baseplate assembly protein
MATIPKAPEIDARTFDELIAEARRRIPQYVPEWTDHNVSDPGITLVELFAWLTETMLYQMNQIPEKSLVKFLELVDQRRQPPEPARAHITMFPKASAIDGRKAAIQIVKGTRFVADAQTEGQPSVFETERSISILPLSLALVGKLDADERFSELSTVKAARSFKPFGDHPQVDGAFYLGFGAQDELQLNDPSAYRNVFPQKLQLRVFTKEDARENLYRPTEIRGDAHPAPWHLSWEYLATGETRSRWIPLKVYLDETLGLTVEGDVILEGPRDIKPASLPAGDRGDGKKGDRHLWLRCRIATMRARPAEAPLIESIQPNTVPVVQLETEEDEQLGVSRGLANERFLLRFGNVHPETLEISTVNPFGDTVAAAEEQQHWTLLDSLATAGPMDKVFTLDIGDADRPATVSFGDGLHGDIPPADAHIVAVRYRHGGGAGGNVNAHTIVSPLVGLPTIDHVLNLRPAVGGKDRPMLDGLKREVPARLRHRNRAVTADDYEALAEQIDGVRQAKVLARHHPDYPGLDVSGALTVFVIPNIWIGTAAEPANKPPCADDAFLDFVAGRLEPFRCVTSEVLVASPDFVAVNIEAVVEAAFANEGDISKECIEALNSFIAPILSPGTPEDDRRLMFGGELVLSKLNSTLHQVPSVTKVSRLRAEIDGQMLWEKEPDFCLKRHQVFWPGGHVIRVVSSLDEELR